MNNNVKTKGYAAFDESGIIKPWEFERRPVEDDDILIEIKAASICHSDIHQEKGHWGKQQYPQVPGHEIAGIVTQVGKNVTKFKGFGAKEVIVVEDPKALYAHSQTLDYMISTIPYQFEIAPYVATVKPDGYFTFVGMPVGFEITLSNIGLAASRVNFNASLIGGMKETQEMVDYCVANDVLPEIQMIKASEITEAWKKVEEKKARYRYVIDTSTI